MDIRCASKSAVLSGSVPVMTFRAVDERDAVLAGEWAKCDGDCDWHWHCESSWKEERRGRKAEAFMVLGKTSPKGCG